MSETTLDVTTGLPVLSDGQWWEVRKHVRDHSFSGLGKPIRIEDGYEVCLMGKKVIPGHVTYNDHWWWSLPKHTPARVVVSVLMSRQITDPNKYRTWTGSNRYVHLVGKTLIEPADVLKAALDIIDERDVAEEAKARKAASDALIGAYPPKTLRDNA